MSLYGWGLRYGGPGENGWGWPIVSIFTLCIAACMAEIASAYPTAGGLYYWASVLGNRHWGWWTAWLNLGGLVTAVAGINWAAAAFFNSIVLQAIFGMAPDLGTQVIVMAGITLVQVLINVFGIALVAFLNQLSVWVHVFGVLAIALLMFLFARFRNGIGFPFQIAPGDPGLAANPPFWGVFGVLGAFLLGLLQAQWIYTAAGTPAVAYALIANLQELGVFLSFVIVVAMFLCGMSAIASTGRMVFVFARDGGMPFSDFFSHGSKSQRVPDVAYVTARGDAFALTRTIGAITGMSTALLYWAYGAPILLGLRSDEWRSRRTWSLGNLSRVYGSISMIWIVIISILFLWRPDNEYAFQGTAGFLVLLVLYYVFWAARNFKGPRAMRPEELVARELEVGERHPGGAAPGGVTAR